MKTRAFKQVDVFTAERYRGNPVAVVLDGSGLDDAQMQRFAHWTHLSETTFLLPPTEPGADYRLRIFSPGGVPLQLLQLGLMLALAGLAFNTVLGAGSGQIGRWLQGRPGAAKVQRALLASVMLGLAVRLLVLDRPATTTRGL